MRRRGFIGSILGGIGACFLDVKRSTAKAGALRPPPRAVSAGFSDLIFAEEFDRTPDIGFGTDGHKWNAGLWWEPVPSPNALNVSDGILTITAGTNNDVNLCTQYHDASGGTQLLGAILKPVCAVSTGARFGFSVGIDLRFTEIRYCRQIP